MLIATPSGAAAQTLLSLTSKRGWDREEWAALLRVRTGPECPEGNLRELAWDSNPDCGIALLWKALTVWSRLWFFQWSCMDVRVGLWRKLSAKKLMLLNCDVGEDSWESLGLQGDPTSPSWRRSVPGVQWKDWCWSWNFNTLATSWEELTHLRRLWCWERLRAGGEGDDRGWDGWMASPTWWAWLWVSSGSWWWTGRPGVLRFMGSQSVEHDRATELNWTEDTARPAHRTKDWAELAGCGPAHPLPETSRPGQPEPERGHRGPREASSTKLQADFIANQDFLGIWTVDIRREGRS